MTPKSDKALIARQTSQDVREILVASAGRTRCSKQSSNVMTQRCQALVCFKHVLCDVASKLISECCLSNCLILPQQLLVLRKKLPNTEVNTFYMRSVSKVMYCICTLAVNSWTYLFLQRYFCILTLSRPLL